MYSKIQCTLMSSIKLVFSVINLILKCQVFKMSRNLNKKKKQLVQ